MREKEKEAWDWHKTQEAERNASMTEFIERKKKVQAEENNRTRSIVEEYRDKQKSQCKKISARGFNVMIFAVQQSKSLSIIITRSMTRPFIERTFMRRLTLIIRALICIILWW